MGFRSRIIVLVLIVSCNASAQLSHTATASAETVDLTVTAGTALQAVLDREVRIRRVGQAIHGHVADPVYAFDKLVVPAGTKVNGKISEIGEVSARTRTLAALDANLTPQRKIVVEFTELVLPDGKTIKIQTGVVRGSGQVLKFVTAGGPPKGKGVRERVHQQEKQTADQIRQQYETVRSEVERPGRMHRLERLAVAQSPIHPQYLDAGTVYFAELKQNLEFGSESLTADMAQAMKGEMKSGSVIARLMTPLSSATADKGADVEAVVSQPVLSDGKLMLPQGSLLKGAVVEVQPARYWKRNGQLRFVFRDLVLANGVESKVDGILQGVQSDAADKLNLDSEGGASQETPKTRYLRTAVSVGLAAATHEDETLNRAEGGAGGFKVVGIVVGAAVKSQPLAIAMGAFGASRSIYVNFIARGRDVEFARDTVMQIEIDLHEAPHAQPASK
jgi:hypothetical protein